MSSKIPAPGAEDLWPHVAQLVDPGGELDGEIVVGPRVLGLLIAPSVDEFMKVWAEQEERISSAMLAGRFEMPKEWEQGARRRSKELQARYNSLNMVDILRGLHREYGVLPQGV
ncbi:MAG: hypothetical protein ABIS86_08260 [Streptosporangiaceae bacterium]